MRVDDEIKKKFVDSYRRHRSTFKVAKQFGCGASTVHRWLVRANVKLDGLERYRKSIRKLSSKQNKAIARAYTEGVPLKTLAKKYGVKNWTILDRVKKAGVVRRKRGGQVRKATKKDFRRAAALYRRLKSQDAVARTMGVSQPTVSQWLRAQGIVSRGKLTAEKHGSWRGGRVSNGQGYILIYATPDHPFASMRSRSGYILEHRLVVAQILGRPLTKKETVHHINGKRADNRPENLELRHGQHGQGVRMKCKDCGSRNIQATKLDR